MRSRIKFLIIASLLAALPTAASAHTAVGHAFSFSSGFLHPLGGLDHLLAMFAVGLLAAQLGGRAIWLVPATFVSVMVMGALAGMAGLQLPGTEYGILLSVIVIALPVAFALGMPTGLAMALVGVFAVFHGHAHGAEIPVGAGTGTYIAGFALATALIHAGGVFLGLLLGRLAAGTPALRLAGGAIALTGCILALA
jgi:urease accessory protein